ncbi:MAG TPA: sulfite exporter TauE/SafE family protein [Tissierellaceae bacterium]|nr:sulfite exporter TauE/SafE family protein [Tissierellaceae bacterium]
MDNNKYKLIAIGIIAGLVNGLFGSGGGTIVVPSLVFLLKLKDYKAHATAIPIILPLSIISVTIYLFNNKIPLDIALYVASGGIAGSYLGAKFLNKIPVKYLRKIFGSVIIYTAIRMILR